MNRFQVFRFLDPNTICNKNKRTTRRQTRGRCTVFTQTQTVSPSLPGS